MSQPKKSAFRPLPPLSDKDLAEAAANIERGLNALDEGEEAFQNFLDELYPNTGLKSLGLVRNKLDDLEDSYEIRRVSPTKAAETSSPTKREPQP